ncbi:DNA-binding response regulator [Longibacter salinarum]|uniref:DNA-binding response regulator n=1 Tax=Longibacter salinarum TaxID=1850348 RepID=A0A2A8CVP5_9BACT|nr:response regulator transcription factor [Longibacter salinarum]PEN12785.1 DNA-binding response regulator [Longibacter salinarum]
MTRSDASGDTVILVVDDEQDIIDLLDYNLTNRGYEVAAARDGQEALATARDIEPDLIILDVMMPEMDGLETCRRIRQDAYLRTIPVLMLTARTEEESMIEGLESGADSYLSKPVSIPVIVSQVRALLRSSKRNDTPPDTLSIHDLTIDRDRFIVIQEQENGSKEMHFPKQEFELLQFMASHPGTAFTRQEILDEVWGPDVYVVDRTVDVHVRKIREKIGSDYIETIKGVGYRFRG